MDNKTAQAAPRRLGDYLVCSEGVLHNAENRQFEALAEEKTPQRIGQVLIEDDNITEEELQNALSRQRADRLSICPVFNTLSKMELMSLSHRFKEVTVPSGRQFIIQDQPDPSLFIICNGNVEVYRTTLAGEHMHIAFVDAPEPIGEMGYFSGDVRSASVKAVDTTQLLCAEYSALTHYFENVPKVAFAFTSLVEARRKATQAITTSGS